MTFELPNGLPEGPWSLKTSPYYFSIADIKDGFVCQISRSDEREPIAIAIASIPDMVEEIGRLQAELSEFTKLKEYAKSLGQETYLEIHAANESLRALNAELREALADALHCIGLCSSPDEFPEIEKAHVILVKSQEAAT